MPDKTPQNPTTESFQRVGIVDNFYQASSFIPMSFALVTTVHENGETGIGPHALLFPFSITKPHSMMLISRNNSGTATNIRRHGKCALNYVPFDRDRLQGIADMGYPGMSLEDKARANPYTMIDSPSPGKAADPDSRRSSKRPTRYSNARGTTASICTTRPMDSAMSTTVTFNLIIDDLLVKERFVPGIEKGAIFPNMPIFCGYRANRGFWFAEHDAPFNVPLPTVEGMEHQTVSYMANRIDSRMSVSPKEACKKLTGIPQPFMQDALKEIVAMAIADGISEIDENYLEKINAERG